MPKSLTFLLIIVGFAVSVFLGFFAGPVHDKPVHRVTETRDEGNVVDRPLRALMVGLGQDMARISDGIWHEDFPMIEQGAQSIATHPKITPLEMAAIKEALGDSFSQFVGFDKVVHGTAEELVAAAQQGEMQRILDLQRNIRQGCVSCHATFRDDVRHALARAELQR